MWVIGLGWVEGRGSEAKGFDWSMPALSGLSKRIVSNPSVGWCFKRRSSGQGLLVAMR